MHRRDFISFAAGSIAANLLGSKSFATTVSRASFRAVVFDGFPIFDPRPIFSLAEELFPGRGAELSDKWRTRQFEYTWLRTIEGRYLDFYRVTEDALVFAANSMKLDLKQEVRERLMDGYVNLKAWPDVKSALDALKSSGVRLGILSNFTKVMLDANIRSAGLQGYFEQLLSTDQVRQFKPAPQAYQMGVEAFSLPRQNILFAVFGGWDAAGAKSFGYPTFWINRLQSPIEELGFPPDGIGGMADLVKFVLPGPLPS